MKNYAKLTYAKITDGIARQRIITYACYAIIIATAILSSAISMTFGLEDFNPSKFAFNLCMSLAIGLTALLLSMRDGEMVNDDRKSGDYFEAKQGFKATRAKIIDVGVFRQYTDLVYERERKSYVDSVLDGLFMPGFYKHEYLEVDDKTFKKLLTEPTIFEKKDGSKVPLDTLSKNQYKAIKQFRDGRYKFNKLDYSFFISRGRNGYKAQADLQDKERSMKVMAVIYRGVVIALSAVIFALAIVNPTSASGQQVAFDGISRIWTMVTSLFMGYTIANDEMKKDIGGLEYKVEIINQYFNEKEVGTFKPLNVDEQILKKIAEKEKEKVQVEVMPMPEPQPMLPPPAKEEPKATPLDDIK